MKKLLLSLIALLFAINLYAQPSTITYQGVLTDNGGAVLTGTYDIRFNICTASSGANSVWSETHSNVNVTNGLFQVELGSVAAFSTIPLDFSTPYWLEITIDPSGANTTLTPRVAFNASGYSLSGHATSLKIATDAGLGKVLTSDANGDAAWSDFIGFEYVNPMSATGDILYSTGENLIDFAALPIGTAGQVLTVNPGETAPVWADAPSGGSAISAFGYIYQLATIVDATVVGGADVPFSNNGPLSGVTHTAGTTTITVPSAGNYKIDYNVSITAGIGAALAIAVNGIVTPSSTISFLEATGQVSGTVILTLAAGDVVTLRNNSAVAFTLSLAPSVSAQLNLIKLD